MRYHKVKAHKKLLKYFLKPDNKLFAFATESKYFFLCLYSLRWKFTFLVLFPGTKGFFRPFIPFLKYFTQCYVILKHFAVMSIEFSWNMEEICRNWTKLIDKLTSKLSSEIHRICGFDWPFFFFEKLKYLPKCHEKIVKTGLFVWEAMNFKCDIFPQYNMQQAMFSL